MTGIYKRCNPIKDNAVYDQYIIDFPFCQVCGSRFMLSRHHIIGGCARSDEGANLIVSCLDRCHPLMEGRRVVVRGVRYEPLTLGMVLAIKKLRTPDLWNPARLAELHGSSLPELEEILEWVHEAWRKRRK